MRAHLEVSDADLAGLVDQVPVLVDDGRAEVDPHIRDEVEID